MYRGRILNMERIGRWVYVCWLEIVSKVVKNGVREVARAISGRALCTREGF